MAGISSTSEGRTVFGGVLSFGAAPVFGSVALLGSVPVFGSVHCAGVESRHASGGTREPRRGDPHNSPGREPRDTESRRHPLSSERTTHLVASVTPLTTPVPCGSHMDREYLQPSIVSGPVRQRWLGRKPWKAGKSGHFGAKAGISGPSTDANPALIPLQDRGPRTPLGPPPPQIPPRLRWETEPASTLLRPFR